MFEIDYSTPRKFLMSFGLTLVFLSGLIIWTSVVFFVDRAENILGIYTSNSCIPSEYEGAIGPIIKAIPSIIECAIAILIFGSLLFLIGTIWWAKEEKWLKAFKKH